MALELTINGTPYEIGDQWGISRPQNGAWRLECSAWLDEPGDAPALDDEIVLTDGGTPIFTGTVQDLTLHGINGQGTTEVDVDISALDYNALPSRRFVTSLSIPAGTLKAALQVLVTYLSPVTLDGGQVDGPTLPAIEFSAWSVQQCLEYLTSLTGGVYVWRVSQTSALSMFEIDTVAAPFDLADDDGLTVGDVTVQPTRTNYANYVIVVGHGVTAVAQDATAVAAHGRWDYLVQADDVTTQAGADTLAASELSRRLPILKTVTYTTHEPGLEPGQTQSIVLTSRGLNNTFVLTEVSTRGRGELQTHSVTALEGLLFRHGWREPMAALFGGGGSTTMPGLGAGGGSTRFPYTLAAAPDRFVRSATPDWVDISPAEVYLNTVSRGSTLATITAMLRAVEAGVSVQARLFESGVGPCAGLSTVVTSTAWTRVTWTVTLTAGGHYYRLQVLPGAADADVSAVGYLE